VKQKIPTIKVYQCQHYAETLRRNLTSHLNNYLYTYIEIMDLSESEIEKALASYKKQKIYRKTHYEKIKHTDAFMQGNRERAKKHYYKKKEKGEPSYYSRNKQLISMKRKYKYHLNRNIIEKYKQKYPQDYNTLKSIGYAT